MNDDNYDNVSFFSKITASVTHELNNVMSIMTELNGLFEDQLLMADSGHTFNPEKLKNIHDKLSNQIKRVQAIAKNLNYFSHTVDNSSSQIELISLIKNIIFLTQRFTSLANVTIVESYSNDSIMISVKPFVLSKLIFTVIMFLSKIVEKNSKIYISLEKDEKLNFIKILFNYSSASNFSNQEFISDTSYLTNFAESINCDYKFYADKNLATIKIIHNK